MFLLQGGKRLIKFLFYERNTKRKIIEQNIQFRFISQIKIVKDVFLDGNISITEFEIKPQLVDFTDRKQMHRIYSIRRLSSNKSPIESLPLHTLKTLKTHTYP